MWKISIIFENDNDIIYVACSLYVYYMGLLFVTSSKMHYVGKLIGQRENSSSGGKPK